MPKRIVVCCDGTWNTPNQPSPTNVVKLARAVLPTASDGTPQMVFYDWGVGTERGLDRWLGGAFGRGLLKNVEDGYRFIAHNYERGDQLFIFGFSRGAYTARSLVGFIRNCGLLKKRHADLIGQAVALYKSPGFHPDSAEAVAYRADHSREIDVHFIGVWDTVGALGIPLPGLHALTRKKYQFHDVELSGIVKNAVHALAIDEQRWAFRPAVWKAIDKPGQTVEQVWFAGVHSDVGGGYADAGLSETALRWMVGKAAGCGLEVDQGFLDETTHPDPMGALHDSRQGFYKWLRPHVRPIAEGDGANESVDESAMRRFKAGGYAPANLSSYVARTGANDGDRR